MLALNHYTEIKTKVGSLEKVHSINGRKGLQSFRECIWETGVRAVLREEKTVHSVHLVCGTLLPQLPSAAPTVGSTSSGVANL